MSRIFIERPIFAWVLAIVVMMTGVGALLALPIAQYPDIAPVRVNVRATYPGANAQTLENSVTQVLEQSLSGLDGLLYFSSQSSARGTASITAVFAKGTSPDVAQVQVQNQIQTALSRLPQQVQQQGVRVTKSAADQLMFVVLYDDKKQPPPAAVCIYEAQGIGGKRMALFPTIWRPTSRIRSRASKASATSPCSAHSTRSASGSIRSGWLRSR